MAKVIFEFDESEDRDDINIIVNRHKLRCALLEIQNLRRTLYKGYYNPDDYVSIQMENNKPVKMVTWSESEEVQSKNEPISNTQIFVNDEFVINGIDRALSDINSLLE